jgi:hypothetical protein
MTMLLFQIHLTVWDLWIVIIWLLQLAVGCGAGYAAYRLWQDRANQFVRRAMYHLHATMIIALATVVLPFMSKDVRLTWRFTYTLFIFMGLWNLVSLPLILFVIRGPKTAK